jgi:methionine sulfoxide reductase heme-binding subunit
MSDAYRPIDWNPQKRAYDLALAGGVAAVAAAFGLATGRVSPEVTAETVILRTTAVCALLLLHVILCIGPLARLDRRFLPLLYNRRHLGVTMAFLATLHAGLAVFQFHGLGDTNPVWSALTAYDFEYRWPFDSAARLDQIPFEPFGVAAWVILVLMAATSHDFWLRQLGAPVWKALHCGVYAAYLLLLTHVAFGVLQTERAAGYPVLLALGWVVITTLHLAAALKERRKDHTPVSPADDGWEKVALADDVPEGRGRVVVAGRRRIALFRHDGVIYAVSNVCRHQGGPLGEGRILDGCITCPWHGWNYQPADGCSPPPFDEVVPTFPTRIQDGAVWVDPRPSPLRTVQAGARADAPTGT